MKTKKTPQSRKPTLLHTLAVTGAAMLATLGGLPVHAATTSFPQYPLLTGGGSIPPNILLILDDSGSMVYAKMPGDESRLEDDVEDRSYVNNTLYYNPAKTYLPWRTHSTNLNDRLAAASYTNVVYDAVSTTNSNRLDLRGSEESYFYVPKTGVASPGTNRANYDKYRIGMSSSSTSWNGGAVQKVSGNQSLASGNISSIAKGNASACIQVPIAQVAEVTITVSGSGRAALYGFQDESQCSNWDEVAGRHTGSDDPKVIRFVADGDGAVWFRVYNSYNGNGTGGTGSLSYTAVIPVWSDMTPKGNTSALQQAELQNYANWYQYHRTRNKMAKAGASEAFGKLGENYRVGFDTIWNRGGDSENPDGDTPALPIDWDTDGGLFKGDNRKAFYDHLQDAQVNGYTPLHGALQRAARYFRTDDPWKDSNGSLVTCRQNYALLTTDGYWNDYEGYTTNVGNADNVSSWAYRDAYSQTLADVAYYYWKNDMRTDMSDNVRPSSADPADWQHMTTFGISIGLQGTLDPNNPPPSPWNINPNDQEDKERIDDLWHAAINGHGSFIVASDTEKFADALTKALSDIESRTASGSNIASSSTKTDTTTLTFVAGFTSGTWLGDLMASPFNAGLTGVSNTPNWVLSMTFGAGKANANFTSREVLTSKGGVADEFDTSMTGAGDFTVRTGQADAVSAADNIAYLKGVQTKELGQTGGTLRKRAYPIGDIVNSSPAYMASTNTVFIGANDGMLHGIDASNGEVLFSYVPKGIDFAAMANLSSTSYSHRFFMDGQIDVRALNANGNNTNDILVAALGRGGRGVFALDVSDPDTMGTSDVLWDNTTQDSTTDANMGYVLGNLRIRKGNGDKNYLFVPNGIDSPNGSATLFVYELSGAGAITATHQLVADASGSNGLMSLGMADLNADGKVDTVYGGDLKGNIWRWDFSTASMPTAAVKLFQAKDSAGNPQPVTGGIGVGRNDLGGDVFIGFGTGRFISTSDMPSATNPASTQSLYGLHDEGTAISGRSDLQERTIPYTGTGSNGEKLRGFENYAALPANKKGWFIDLPVPERVISSPTIYGTGMFLSSVIPAQGQGCDSAYGSGWLNAINLFTGTSPNSGGYFDGAGTVSGGNETGQVGSIGINTGMPTEVNVTSGLATVGTGNFSNAGTGNTISEKLKGGPGGQPQRVTWREIVPKN